MTAANPEDPVFRAPIRARSVELAPFEGAKDAVDRGIVGIGEPLRDLPRSLDQAVEMTVREHSEKSGRMLARFAALPRGSFVWTRTAPTTYRLGRITGHWHHDASRAARKTGIRNVRPACWIETVFDQESTPDAVVETFARGGRNLQAIGDPDAALKTDRLWRVGDPAPATFTE